MADAGNSRHQSRLAREMARDLGRNDLSIASSTGSHHGSVSSDEDSWDPENEAECSTGRKFPELRDTAKKYGKWNAISADKDNNTDNYYLDTSAIGRAFPDFTQGLDSDISSAFSIEEGRGTKPGVKQRVPSSRVVRQEYSDNVDAVVNISNYRIMGTPPLVDVKQGQSSKQASRQPALRGDTKGARSTPQKENIDPSAPPSSGRRQKNYISGATRGASGEQRRSLAELQAGVADDSEGSFISDERPATVTLTKSSRFAQPRASPLAKMPSMPKPTLANTLASKRSLTRDPPRKALSDTKIQQSRSDEFCADLQRSPSPPTKYGSLRKAPSSINQTTEQSFLIPNADAFSIIGASPIRGAASSLASRSRFGGGPNKPNGGGHNQIDGVPVPSEERAIFLSLQLLQEKVSRMETEKANDDKRIKQLQEENYKLEVKNQEFERRRRADSALGDSGSEAEKREQNKVQKLLESQKKDLEAQVEEQNKSTAILKRDAQEKDVEFKQLAQERNSAVAQLEEAWKQQDLFEQENLDLRKENDQLKREKIELIQENSQMKAQLSRIGKESEENTRRWNSKEQDFRTQLKEIVAVPDASLRLENAELKAHLTRINTDFEKVQRQLQQLNKALSNETAKVENLENQTRQFNMKETELREKLANEVNRRTEMENATQNQTRQFTMKESELREKLANEVNRRTEMENAIHLENKTVEFMSKKENDLRCKLDDEIRRRTELEATTRQALIKENELRDRLDREVSRRAKLGVSTGSQKIEQIREDVSREFQLREKELTQKIERREKAIGKVRTLMDEITGHNLPQSNVGKDGTTTRQRSASQPLPIEREATRTLEKDTTGLDFEDFSIPPVNKSVQETDDASDDGSFALNSTQTIHKDINVTKQGDTQSTNFSDICGPGVMQAMRDGVAYARFRKAELDAGRPDPEEFMNHTMNETMASVKSGRSMRSTKSVQSVKPPVGILKRGESDDTRQSVTSQKSARDNDTMRSMASQRSNISRRHSLPEAQHKKGDTGKANATIDLTSAYLIPDITLAAATGPSTAARAEPLSDSAKRVFNKLCRHDSGNCTMCARIATYDATGKPAKQTITVKRPVPVSSRARSFDATLRPFMSPGKALALVMKGLEDELAHLNVRHADFQRHYFGLDAVQDSKKAQALETKLDGSLKAIKRKRKQIYDLGDVLEGQKEAGMEMTMSQIEVTLVGLGVDSQLLFTEKRGNGGARDETGTGKYFEDLDVSWAGIEESTQ